MPPDFLNSREDALLVWAALILGFVLWKDFRGVGGSFVAVGRALLQAKLLLLFGSALAYSAVIVYILSELGGWHIDALKVTVYWYVGTAIALAGAAVTEGAQNRSEYVRKVLRRVVAVTVLIEFVVGVYALPLAFEFIGAGLVIGFSGVQALTQHDAATPPARRAFIDGVLVAVGAVYLGYFAWRVASDVGAFLTRANLEDFLVPPLLTLALVLFLLTAAWVSRREQENLRRRFQAHA
jgi:hypothetical protein